MKYAALSLGILGIFVLFGIMLFLPVREIESVEDFESLELNEKVALSGIVDSERIVGELNIMQINGIEVVCDCVLSFEGKSVRVMGKVEEYNGKKQVRVLRIEATKE